MSDALKTFVAVLVMTVTVTQLESEGSTAAAGSSVAKQRLRVSLINVSSSTPNYRSSRYSSSRRGAVIFSSCFIYTLQHGL